MKGEEKKDFIRTLVPSHCTVVDLQSLGCPSIKALDIMFRNDTLRCRHHIALTHRCALSLAVNLRKWLLTTKREDGFRSGYTLFE